MKRLRTLWGQYNRLTLLWLTGLAILSGLMLYKLGSLTGGLSKTELDTAITPVGWHGIFNDPLGLPLELARSVVFFLSPDHGHFLTRLPNVIFGAMSIVGLAWVVYIWHGQRTALLTSALFATSAWVLHVSRLASFDVLYLWAMVMLLVVQVLLHRYSNRALAWYGILLAWGLLLYVPGMIWLLGLQIILQRTAILRAIKHFNVWWQQSLTALLMILPLPLLALTFTRSGDLMQWLGIASNFSLLETVKDIALVPVHLFLFGPQQADLWLGRAPLLDIFSLVACALGIYFYAKHWKSSRSRFIGLAFIISAVLIGLSSGTISLSLAVPLLYIAIATGIAYLLHDWLKVFPNNPLARGFGIGLIAIAVSLSCLYNMRAYYIAWPHNTVTQATFRYHR